MFLKVEDFSENSSGLPCFYECERINPGTANGVDSTLILESAKGAVSIEMLPDRTYYVLNNDGGTIDTLRRRKGAAPQRPAGPRLHLYGNPAAGWLGYIEGPGGVESWVGLDGLLVPNTHTGPASA